MTDQTGSGAKQPQTETPQQPQKKKFFRYLTYKEPRWFHIFIHTGFIFAVAIALIIIGVTLWINPGTP